MEILYNSLGSDSFPANKSVSVFDLISSSFSHSIILFDFEYQKDITKPNFKRHKVTHSDGNGVKLYSVQVDIIEFLFPSIYSMHKSMNTLMDLLHLATA